MTCVVEAVKYRPAARWVLLLTGLWLAACGEPVPREWRATEFDNYVETGDLSALEERGILRFLAPRFDEDATLPREGMSVSGYHVAAEVFAERLGLEPEWIYVEDFGDLIVGLELGYGDIVVTSLSNTPARESLVDFSVPIRVVNEVLILQAGLAGWSPASGGELFVSVPEGTAYLDTANALAADNPNVLVSVVPGNASDVEMVEGVAAGIYQATIVDSDVAPVLLKQMPGVVRGPVVFRDREIAWAMRQDSPQLRQRINEYITAMQVVGSRDELVQRNWNAIQRSGVLRVITANNAASYFVMRGELMGFDYDVIKAFADHHNLQISVIVRDSPEAMKQALDEGLGDVIAASIVRTAKREEAGWNFTWRYLGITEQFIGRSDLPVLTSPTELARRTVAVNPEDGHLETLLDIVAQGIDMDIKLLPGASIEMLADDVANGKYDYTILSSHHAALETSVRDDLHVVYDIGNEQKVAWVVRSNQPQLRTELNLFIRDYYRSRDYNVLFNRYFRETESITALREQRVEKGKAISPYDEIVQKYAERIGYDWRLIVAQMYQESRFDPDARSRAGAVGLMQVLPRTAAQFGMAGDLHEPAVNIKAAVRYLAWLADRFPKRLPFEERIYFSLAAYNAGHGHVQDARSLARQLGLNPDRWFGHVEVAMLKLSDPHYFQNARYGYVRGSEPVRYVREIRERYVSYLQANGDAP